MHRSRNALFAFAFCFLLLPPLVQAQPSAEEVLKNVVDNYEQRMAGVDNFTVVTTMEGSMQLFDKMTMYYQKVERDGETMFDSQVQMEGGMAGMAGGGASRPNQTDPITINRKLYAYFADTAEYEGTETVDGETAHVVFIEDMTPLYRDLVEEEEQDMPDDFEARNARLYVDSERWVPLKMSMEMTMPMGPETRTMQMTTLMADYREVGPMLYPYRITNTMQNAMSDEQRTQMQQQMEQAKAQMENLPEAARKQMEDMLESSEGMMGETVEFSMVAQEVKVNEGPPEGME